MASVLLCAGFLLGLLDGANCQGAQKKPVPEKLGAVSFSTTCNAAAQVRFERGVALLHSFVYSPANAEFERASANDPKCAIAYWGMAMSHFHELWDPPLPASEFAIGRQNIQRAEETGTPSDRERRFIEALAFVYDSGKPYAERVLNYEAAMKKLAAAYPNDTEAQAFYALALLAAASPFDKTHARQKQAIEILQPLFRRFPGHPGIPHYLIHACDSSELASRGVAAARAYSKIAPSAPHALHMPSHIFTRLGMWDDSIRSNPASVMLSGAMMFEFIEWKEAAALIESGIERTIQQKRVTYDLERMMPDAKKVKTSEFASAIIENMGQKAVASD